MKLRIIWIFIQSLLYRLRYDKRYLRGKYFSGKYKGMLNVGWKWVVCDAKGCKRMMTNQYVPWPVSPFIHIVHPENIVFDPDDLDNFQSFGIYYQAQAKIIIGKGTYIGPNVGLITANHDLNDLSIHSERKPITIGAKCWIGMNSLILPGVILGDHTIVGGGSVVTKSFEQGNCVIAGNPAKIIRELGRVDTIGAK